MKDFDFEKVKEKVAFSSTCIKRLISKSINFLHRWTDIINTNKTESSILFFFSK